MDELEPNRLNSEHSGDPRFEEMNNFYCRFPGGSYRLDADPQFQGGINHTGAVVMHERYGEWLDKPEDAWPGEITESIKNYKRDQEILGAVDEALSRINLIGDWWDAWRPYIDQGMKVEVYRNLERMILRPVWVDLRQRGFSRDELSS